MKIFAVDEFASSRRTLQDTTMEVFLPIVSEGLKRLDNGEADWAEDILDHFDTLYRQIYAEETDEGLRVRPLRNAVKDVQAVLDKTKPDSNLRAMTLILTLIAINTASMAAADADPEPLVLEWVTMNDTKVRHEHVDAHGQQRPAGEAYEIGGEKLRYPGDPTASIGLWINCRCVLRPALMESLAASSVTESDHTSLCIVALPAADQSVHQIGEEQKHATILFFGDVTDPKVIDDVRIATAADAIAGPTAGFSAQVESIGELGPEDGDKAKVWLLGESPLSAIRDALLKNDVIKELFDAVEQYPEYTPHSTITYEAEAPPEAEDVKEITFDRLAVWHGEQQDEYPLGEPMSTTAATEVVEDDTEVAPVDAGLVPWHGILAPEGKRSGDGRTFLPGSLTHRPLTDRHLPLRYQEVDAAGHEGSVVVATIEGMGRDPEGQIWGWGNFRHTDKADEVIGLISEFGKFGVSVDADDSTLEFNETDESVEFSHARICSACICSIPAFAEAFTAIGEIPPEVLASLTTMVEEEEDDDEMPFPPEEEMPPEGEPEEDPKKKKVPSVAHLFGRGPGWITNPVGTRRIHSYWTKPGQEGFKKIGWGVGGDFNRCRVLVGEKIAQNSPEDMVFLNQICAQWHHDALGIWPGEHLSARDSLGKMKFVDSAPALNLVASATGWCAPSEWFQDPQFTEGDGRMVRGRDGQWACPMTVQEDGRVFGHIAGWKSCHLSVGANKGVCTAPPHSQTGYSYFLSGAVLTDGGLVPVGHLTIGGGHADPRLGLRPALAHYDNTCTAVADVTVGEDAYGIWFAGWVRPGATPEQVIALRASPLSGDWRRVKASQTSGFEYEMIAALGVNSPGFSIPRVGVGTHNGEQMSLIAAGYIPPPDKTPDQMVINEDSIAEKIAAAMENRVKRRERFKELLERVGRDH